MKIEENLTPDNSFLVTKEGQIRKGDKITIIGKNANNTLSSITVKDVVFCERGDEEIIISKQYNKYFRTCMVVDGISWVKRVYIR